MKRACVLHLVTAVWVGVTLGTGIPPVGAQHAPLSNFTDHVGDLAETVRPFLVRVVRPSASGSPGAEGELVTRLIGSGVSLGEGFILTSASVAGPAEALDIVLASGEELAAEVVGVDRRSNISLLRIDRTDLPAIPMARIPLTIPGELVLAAGLGPESGPEASFGTVVLVKGPNLQFTGSEMIEVTAPVFPGLTGGALLNRRGEMVGLISGWLEFDPSAAIVPPGTDLVAGFVQNQAVTTQTLETATLAVPILRALDILENLKEHGYVKRGYLGLQLELTQIAPERSRRLRGVMVHGVVTDGPAASAGLIPGDVILSYAGAQVGSPADLSYLVSASLPGISVPVQFLRRGRRHATNVYIQQAPELEWVSEMDTLISDVLTSRVAGNDR